MPSIPSPSVTPVFATPEASSSTPAATAAERIIAADRNNYEAYTASDERLGSVEPGRSQKPGGDMPPAFAFRTVTPAERIVADYLARHRADQASAQSQRPDASQKGDRGRTADFPGKPVSWAVTDQQPPQVDYPPVSPFRVDFLEVPATAAPAAMRLEGITVSTKAAEQITLSGNAAKKARRGKHRI